MNQDVSTKYKEADKNLNEVYQQILKKYKTNGTFIKNIRNAQRVWIEYRDAQFEMNYPKNDSHYNRNTITDSEAIYLTRLTNERTKTLMEILDPTVAGLIAYYPFHGNARDISGNGNDGVNRDAELTVDRFGNIHSAYHFMGGASILIPELFPNMCLSFTFAAWVMKDGIDGNNHIIIYKGLDQGEASMGITNGILAFGVNLENGGHGNQNWYSAGNIHDTLKAKTYYFLVGRYVKGQQIELLINGKLIGSSAVPDLPLAKWPTHSYSAIGTHPTFPTTYYWNGVIDDVRIYNRALSDDEVQSLYHERGWTGN
jgi:uncharacterized protein YecT (DUF1311 family)